RFGFCEILTAFVKDGREDSYVYVSEALMVGMASGVVESVVTSPFEITKLRAQVTSASPTSSSASFKENRAVAPTIARLLHRYTPETKALNQSVGLLSTLTSKHADIVGALQKYPWMMTGPGRQPPVYAVRRPTDIISLEGLGTFWRGLRSGLVQDSIFGGIFFSWQFLHQAMLDWKAVGMNP
ncbi:LOW QUALITY PROTEIN: Mito_carr domain-containing protein, partial [Cephalotus follicularis]